ncbi:MAG: ATP-binding protein [Candidatus Levyibacteriota bacterium]
MVNLSEIFSILLVIFFGAIAIYYSFREQKQKKNLVGREELQKQKAYHITILKEIQDKISYSLDIEEIIDVITKSLKDLFPYTSASSMVTKNNKIIFKTNLQEGVNRIYIENVKKSMLASLTILLGKLPENVEEKLSGVNLDYTNPLLPKSFFNIPLIVNNRIKGLINISSVREKLYSESEMTLLYEITAQASNALARLENLLETEKGKLISLISSLVDGVIMIDDKKEVLVINRAAREFLGLKEIQPSYFEIINEIKDKYDLASKMQESLEKNKTIEDKEVDFEGKSLQVFITPVMGVNKSGEKKPIGISILLHDITLEKQLANIREDFTNMVIHEIRAPLTSIKASSDLLLEKKGYLTEEEEEQMLSIVNKQSKVLLDEVGSILDAAKIEAKRFTIHKKKAKFNKTIVDAVSVLLAVAEKKQISINMKLSDNLPEIDFDQSRITQVIDNLLSNSLKFTPEGGSITVTSSLKQNFILVSVIDTGSGIPKDEQAHLFSKFYQMRETPQRIAIKGSGIGLYIAKGIVEAHNGTIWVESEINNGTKMSFTLPLENKKPEEKSKESYSAHQFLKVN